MDSRLYLKKFYTELYINLKIKNKLKKDSVLISLFNIKSNARLRILLDSSLVTDDIPKPILDNLLADNFIRESEEMNKYLITAKGVWFIESDRIMTDDIFINSLDEKFFFLSQTKNKLTDKEKVILFAMVTARTFSESAPINLKRHESTLDAWKTIIDECYKKLYDMKLVNKMSQETLYGKKGNEHMVSHLIRHTDALPKKTKGIYYAAGQQKYYLDISQDDIIIYEKLFYIVKSIFICEKGIEVDAFNDVVKFCKTVAYDKAPFIYTLENHNFIKPKYDEAIEETFKNILYLNYKL